MANGIFFININATRYLVHLCPECVFDFKQLPKTFKLVESLRNEVASLKSKFSKLETKLNGKVKTEVFPKLTVIESNIESLKTKIDSKLQQPDVSTKIISIEDDLKLLKTGMDNTKNNANSQCSVICNNDAILPIVEIIEKHLSTQTEKILDSVTE